ncbi:MAG: hypothetical protein EZS28_036108 [Streblomastix strix]|uniref:Reverse transcriptase domain-containing protein n=1 Tax=Streblomastix strix TaxID=222440 RepID=A0A5J4UD20_9EUKA|nr:MAG: hypothetical protein EZS28_036108 [Streblomastix strix]
MGKIDQKSAYVHIQVYKEFRPFLGFTFNNRFYQYKAMCFGVKHAQLIFHKTLHPVIKFHREAFRVRIIAYCDDIIILHQNQEELNIKKQLIINILTNFGFKISINKFVLIPMMQLEFFGLKIDQDQDQISMTQSRQKKMKQMLRRWRRIVTNQYMVKVGFFASFIGSLNFLRLQFKRVSIHLKKLNKINSRTAFQKG